MSKYESLLIYAESIGIKVKEYDLDTNEECAYYSKDKIIINSRLTEKQKYCLLAEELGHHFTTYLNILDQNNMLNKKLENVARRKGHEFLVEPIDIVYAMKNGADSEYAIAEYLNITESTLHEILNDFSKKYGLGVRLDKYYLAFSPLGLYIDYGGLFKN